MQELWAFWGMESWRAPRSEKTVPVEGMWRYPRAQQLHFWKMMPESPLPQKSSWDLYINPHEMPAWSFAGKDAKTWAAVLTWLCRLGSSGLLGLTAADPRLCWAREIWGSSGTRIHSRDQQIYRSAWKDPWRALSAFPSSRRFWCPWCHPMGSGDVGYLELFGGNTLRGTMPPLHQHPCFTCHQEQDILTHHLNPYFFRGEKCL